MQSDYLAELAAAGLPVDVDFARDTALGSIFAVVADRLGDLAEGTQALYDAFDPANAEGVQLDNIGAITGNPRQAATASTVTLTLSGTPGTVIPAGSIVEGGGTFDDARWTIDAPGFTIGGGGTVTATATCTVTGATVATSSTITEIITQISGWTGVTNPAAAVPGQPYEVDADYRIRRAASLQTSNGPSIPALRSSLLALDYLDAAVVIDNDTDGVVVTSGVTLQAHSVAVIVHPAGLSGAQEIEIAETIYLQLATGVWTNGTVTHVVTGTDGSTKTIRFDYAADVAVNVVIVLTMATGFSAAEAIAAVTTAVTDYFAGLAVGASARRLEIFGLVDTVPGVVAATLTLNGGGSDVTPTLAQKLTLGTLSVS
jgi:uncharacterized phage protein gp47/JayE